MGAALAGNQCEVGNTPKVQNRERISLFIPRHGLVKDWHQGGALPLGGKIGRSKIGDHHQACLLCNSRWCIKLQADAKLGPMKDGLAMHAYCLNRTKAMSILLNSTNQLADFLCERQASLLSFEKSSLAKRVMQLKEGLSKPFRHGPVPEPETNRAPCLVDLD